MIALSAASYPVGDITLFAGSSAAQCTRLVRLSLPPGEPTTFQIEGLPDGFERDTLRVEGYGAASSGVSILDVVPRMLASSEMKETTASARLADLQREIDSLRKQLEIFYTVDNALSRFQQNLSPQHRNADDLATFLTLYESRALKAHGGQVEAQRAIAVLEQKKREAEVKGGRPAGLGAIRVILQAEPGEKAEAKREVDLRLTYFIQGASWRPAYDVRSGAASSSATSPLTIDYKAIISNNTGEDWTGATLSLSTVSPDRPTTIPTPATPELGFRTAAIPPPPPSALAPRGGAMLYAAAPPMASMRMAKMASVVDIADEVDGFGGRQVSVEGGSAGRVGIVMRIEGVVDIASDGEEHRVSITRIVTEARLKHIAVPTRSTSAFIRAETTNPSAFPLLAGPTTLYVAASFAGKGRLPEVGPGGRLPLSLGVDPAVRVTCAPEARFKTTAGGFVRKETEVVSFVRKMTVENTRATALDLAVLFAFPRSTDAKITVRPSLPRGASWDRSSADDQASSPSDTSTEGGRAKWEGSLGPGEKTELFWLWDVEGAGWVVL